MDDQVQLVNVEGEQLGEDGWTMPDLKGSED